MKSYSWFALLVSAWLTGCGAKKPPEEKPAAPVKADPAKEEEFGGWTQLLGVAQPLPNNIERISAAVDGRVLWVLGDGEGKSVAEGDLVEEKQLLAQLDDTLARAERDKAIAARDEARELLSQADYATQMAQVELARVEALIPVGKKESDLPLASKNDLTIARLKLQEAQSKQKAAAARLAGAEADLKGLKEKLALHQIRTSLAGRLGMIQVSPGQKIAAGTPITEVVKLDEVDVLCYVPPSSARLLEHGQEAHIEGHDDVEGHVVFVAPVAQADTGNFAVKVRFDNAELNLRANTVQRVVVLTQPETKRVSIPAAAINEGEETPSVLVVEDVKEEETKEGEKETKGVVRKLRPILGVRQRIEPHAGEHHEPLVELLGLKNKEGENVDWHELLFVTEGGRGLEDGDEVKLEKEEHKEENHKGEKRAAAPRAAAGGLLEKSPPM
jgi:RND family efflux transporter MFP subunit